MDSLFHLLQLKDSLFLIVHLQRLYSMRCYESLNVDLIVMLLHQLLKLVKVLKLLNFRFYASIAKMNSIEKRKESNRKYRSKFCYRLIVITFFGQSFTNLSTNVLNDLQIDFFLKENLLFCLFRKINVRFHLQHQR